MAIWTKLTTYLAIVVLVLCATMTLTSARRDGIYRNKYTEGYNNRYSNLQNRRYDGPAFSIRDNLDTLSVNFAYSKDNSANNKENKDVSDQLKKGFANLKHNSLYHPNELKYFADNSTTSPSTASTTTATDGNYKSRGSFPWILIVLVLTGFILIAALLVLTMSKKDGIQLSHITQDFPDHKGEKKKNDEEQINMEIQNNLEKKILGHAQEIEKKIDTALAAIPDLTANTI